MQKCFEDFWSKKLPHFRDSSGSGWKSAHTRPEESKGKDDRSLSKALDDDSAAAHRPGDHDSTQGSEDHQMPGEGDKNKSDLKAVSSKAYATNAAFMNKCA